MNHVIVGAGNLGRDIELQINANDFGRVSMMSQSTGCKFSKNTEFEFNERADVIWYCLGGGSVEDAKRDPELARAFNLTLPSKIAYRLKHSHTKMVIFSTDYVADESAPSDFTSEVVTPKSMYAKHKLELEKSLLRLNRGNIAVVRVGSLYGTHKPEKTFPGKILRNFGYGDLPYKIKLPQNNVTPTPTKWLAGMLLNNWKRLFNDKCTLNHHCAPNGYTTVHDWAKLVLQDLRLPQEFDDVKDGYFDQERPKFSNLRCSFSDDVHLWKDLWKLHYRKEWFFPRDVGPEISHVRSVIR